MNQTIVFGAGCFWGVQAHFDALPGILKTQVGYAGGHTPNPSYEAVCQGNTGHAEVVKVVYDDAQVSLETLLDQFFSCHNPTTLNRQGPDVGAQYRSCIYYSNPEDLPLIEQAKETYGKIKGNIVTEIKPLDHFYVAEDYHQHYHAKHQLNR